MKCISSMKQKIEDELLFRFLTEKVTAEESGQVAQWCDESVENQRMLEQLYFTLKVSDCLGVMQSVDRDQSWSKLRKRIRQQALTAKRRLAFQRLQRVAAVLFLPVVALTVWLTVQKNEIPIPFIEQHSNPGMVVSFELPDGSKVWLNGGSRLRYPGMFKGKYREVQISGQGYFEIARNAQQPFIVRKDETFSLEVLGTSFNLAAYDDEDIIETTLVEGSLRLKLLQHGEVVQRVMKPNEKVIYAKGTQSESVQVATAVPSEAQTVAPVRMPTRMIPETVKVAKVDPQYDIAWKEQKILFRNHPMEEVIRTLGRYYNVRFVVKDEKVMDSAITGTFTNEQLPQIMEYLMIASGIKYHIIPVSAENEEIKTEIVEIWK